MITEEKVSGCVASIIAMASDICWNEFSSNYLFITSEIKDNNQSFSVQREIRKQENDKKVPILLPKVVVSLNAFYHTIYEINFYVYKAEKERTIIEIQYYIKDSSHGNLPENFSPGIHCKVAQPAYATEDKQKFDANWELGPFLHRWKMFWWRRKAKRMILDWNKKTEIKSS